MSINRKYLVYANGVLAKRALTLTGAVRIAMAFFPSYIVYEPTNSVVWTGKC